MVQQSRCLLTLQKATTTNVDKTDKLGIEKGISERAAAACDWERRRTAEGWCDGGETLEVMDPDKTSIFLDR